MQSCDWYFESCKNTAMCCDLCFGVTARPRSNATALRSSATKPSLKSPNVAVRSQFGVTGPLSSIWSGIVRCHSLITLYNAVVYCTLSYLPSIVISSSIVFMKFGNADDHVLLKRYIHKSDKCLATHDDDFIITNSKNLVDYDGLS